ncbi:MAG: hypothetical protein K5804_17870 [Microbacterium sp.]|uniref:hypothetical protein n=1 Tax=Microbacterium sp. TaxID=51671 RepID=UPI00260FD51A|nr:hypothetical protein [Microbacterium sp.]MCV0420113.1 hypothetical protein [Microbacterium sp.]
MNQYENEDRRKSERRVSPAIAEFALEERGELLARIEVLRKSMKMDAETIAAKDARIADLEQQRGGVVLPARCMELTFTERPTNYAIGWNACLDEVARHTLARQGKESE